MERRGGDTASPPRYIQSLRVGDTGGRKVRVKRAEQFLTGSESFSQKKKDKERLNKIQGKDEISGVFVPGTWSKDRSSSDEHGQRNLLDERAATLSRAPRKALITQTSAGTLLHSLTQTFSFISLKHTWLLL